MANINRHGKWKKFLSVGCSHGHLADPAALRTVLKFKQLWKPDRTFHLGDFTDQTAFRTGAAGTRDETVSLEDDLSHGLRFLEELQPTDLLNGNHEIRLWKMAEHHNAIISLAASRIINDIKSLTDKYKVNYVESYDINTSWIDLSGTKLLHGYMYGENAVRDHAEHFGRCVIAHLHAAGEAPGRRSDHARAWCVGTLANIPSMTYANTRRATARWSHGLAYGEFNDSECHVWLTQGDACQPGGWRLPI